MFHFSLLIHLVSRLSRKVASRATMVKSDCHKRSGSTRRVFNDRVSATMDLMNPVEDGSVSSID